MHRLELVRAGVVYPLPAPICQAARVFVNRWGAPGVIASKFLGIGRAYVPVVAGATSMPLLKFGAASLISAILAVAVCLSPRYILLLFGV